MCVEQTNWERCIEFHGHECPGLAIGYRVALIAMQKLGVTKSSDEELIAIVENNACGVDAIQMLTGCTFGKGNLIFKNYGKQVFTIGNRKTLEAFRISVKSGSVQSGSRQEKIQNILNANEEDFCRVEKIQLDFPKVARIYKTIICEECGEGTAEPHIRLKNDKMLCLECAVK